MRPLVKTSMKLRRDETIENFDWMNGIDFTRVRSKLSLFLLVDNFKGLDNEL